MTVVCNALQQEPDLKQAKMNHNQRTMKTLGMQVLLAHAMTSCTLT
jgi:hypothetical protein